MAYDVRVAWQDLYAIEQSDSMSSNPIFSSCTNIGIMGTGSTGGLFLLPVTEHAHLNPGSSSVEHELATGSSDRITLEYNTVAAEPPTTTLAMPLTANNLSLFLGMLFQAGATEDSSNTDTCVLTCIPYTTSACTHYAHIVRVLGTLNDDMAKDTFSHLMRGCICNSITLSGEEGDILMLSAEIMGTSWDVLGGAGDTILNSIHWTTLTFDQTTPLKWQDMTTELAGSSVDIPGFSITITNNASAIYYSNATIKRFALGRLNGEGTIFIPFSDSGAGGNSVIEGFIADTNYTLEIFNTDGANTDNGLDIALNVRVTDVTFEGDVEIGSAVTFACVDDGTHASMDIKVGYPEAELVRGW